MYCASKLYGYMINVSNINVFPETYFGYFCSFGNIVVATPFYLRMQYKFFEHQSAREKYYSLKKGQLSITHICTALLNHDSYSSPNNRTVSIETPNT